MWSALSVLVASSSELPAADSPSWLSRCFLRRTPAPAECAGNEDVGKSVVALLEPSSMPGAMVIVGPSRWFPSSELVRCLSSTVGKFPSSRKTCSSVQSSPVGVQSLPNGGVPKKYRGVLLDDVRSKKTCASEDEIAPTWWSKADRAGDGIVSIRTGHRDISTVKGNAGGGGGGLSSERVVRKNGRSESD